MVRLPTIALGVLALSAFSFTAHSSPVDAGEISNDEATGRVDVDEISHDESAGSVDVGKSSNDEATGHVGVVFTDVMFDDKVAVHLLLNMGIYEKFLVVISGVKEMEKAHGDLRDFLTESEFFPGENVKFVQGDRLTTTKPHEHNFVGEPIPLENTFEDIIESGFIKKDDKLFVTQIAPTPKKHIEKLAAIFLISSFHLVLDGNSKQMIPEDPTSSDAATLDWLQNLKSTIKDSSANAYVVVTSNHASFVNADSGNYQFYEHIAGYVPSQHLWAALQNPFPASQMLEMNDYIKDDSLSVPLRPYLNCERSDLEGLILTARRRETSTGFILQSHFRNHVEAVISIVEQENLLARADEKFQNLYTLFSEDVKAVFNDDAKLTVQLREANHVASLLQADETELTPFQFEKAKGDPIMKLSNNVESSHGMTLVGLKGGTKVLNLLQFSFAHPHFRTTQEAGSSVAAEF